MGKEMRSREESTVYTHITKTNMCGMYIMSSSLFILNTCAEISKTLVCININIIWPWVAIYTVMV